MTTPDGELAVSNVTLTSEEARCREADSVSLTLLPDLAAAWTACQNDRVSSFTVWYGEEQLERLIIKFI